ncbi:potassium transporter KefA [Candidatus Campbellbacteria bacterium]|nr:potassium transporter KefA [Candidatus Campbellbacteria bacterium]|tara:strand:- start:6656 stop:7531 length:876 start_codon:yes stop_codon:yes gene_type:complete
MESLTNIITTVELWLVENALIVLLVFIVTWVVSHFMNSIITRIVRRMIPRGSFISPEEEKKREDTLIKISQNFFGILIWIAAFLVLLDSLGVPIAPLLTGAGILGVALGFGSQSLVKDIINGLFIIAENQFRIGDVVQVGEHYGTVEGMTLRVTKLRQLNGTVHYIPNGEIKVASNKSMDYSMVDIIVDVGYNTKVEHLKEVIDSVGQELYDDPEFNHHIIEAPHFLRIDDFSDNAIKARILGKVYPKQQYLVAGEMRKRLKKAFEQHKIEIPYQTRVVYNIQKNNNDEGK